MSFLRSRQSLLLAALLGGLLFALLFHSIFASGRLTLLLGSITAPGWSAEGINLQLLQPAPGRENFLISIAKLHLPGLAQPLQQLSFECSNGRLQGRQLECPSVRIGFDHPLLGRQQSAGSLLMDLQQPHLQARLNQLRLADGTARIELRLDAQGWQATVDAKALQLQQLTKLAAAAGIPVDLAEWSLQSQIDAQLELNGSQQKLTQISGSIGLRETSFSDADGTYLAEGLQGSIAGQIGAAAAGWQGSLALQLDGGEALTPFFYTNLADHPLHLSGDFRLDEAGHQLELISLHHRQGQLIDLSLDGRFSLGEHAKVEQLALQLEPVALGDLHRELLQPVLLGTPWERLTLQGSLSGSLQLHPGHSRLDAILEGGQWDDQADGINQRRLGLQGVDGHLHWSQSGPAAASWLRWQGGHLLERIPIGPGRLDFTLTGQRFQLKQPSQIPVLDGALQLEQLILQVDGDEPQLQFDGFLTPISMASLSQALEWPPLSGKLSGMIPGMNYANGSLSIDGALLVKVFDGDILIRDLQLQDLLGVYPRLQADIEMQGLDLETLTRTFSFGRITGRLDGYMRELQMEAWRPVSFDAFFHTPEDDDSRRRISQQAVDNISNLGGSGISGSLARSFLRFFEEFGYSRLGIGCRLQAGVCQMSGVGEADRGYYLVEGGGIPRIDVIGYNRTANWDSLLERLKGITQSGGAAPVIQ